MLTAIHNTLLVLDHLLESYIIQVVKDSELDDYTEEELVEREKFVEEVQGTIHKWLEWTEANQ